MTLSPLHLAIVPSRARESFPELPAFTPNFVPLKIIKRRNRVLVSTLEAAWAWSYLCTGLCGGPQDADDRPGSQWLAPTCGRQDKSFTSLSGREGPGSVPARVTRVFLRNLGHQAALETKPLLSGQSQPFFSDLGIGVSLTGDFRRERCILCGRSCLPECDVYAVCLAGVTFKSVV